MPIITQIPFSKKVCSLIQYLQAPKYFIKTCQAQISKKNKSAELNLSIMEKKAKTARKGTEHTALKVTGEENSITYFLTYFTY